MREKRDRKTKKLDDFMIDATNEPKHKKIQKNKRQNKKNKNEKQSEQNDQIEASKEVQNQKNKGDENIKQSAKKQKLKHEKKQMQDEQNHESSTKNPINKQKETNTQTTMTSLAKLNENFKQVKAIYQENLAKCNFHKNQFEQLSQKVNESNMNIQKKAKQLTDMSKNIYLEAVRSNRQIYLNQNTFINSAKHQEFIQNLLVVAETLSNCPYEDPLQKFKLTKLHPQSLTLSKHFKVGQQKKQKIIKDHLTRFPYVTIGEQYISLLQALVNSTKYIQKHTIFPIIQFPCLFMRESQLSYSIIQKSKNILYKIIFENDNKIIKAIHSLLQQQDKQNSLQVISQLANKALNKIKFISLPQIQFQLRSFSYAGSIYINTYYIEKQSTLTKQINIAYCVLACIRQLANFVQNNLIYSLNKNDEDIGKNISEIRQRSDFGAKLEKILTGGNQFVCASSQDYNLLCSSVGVKFLKLGKHDSQYQNAFVFEQERKRKDTITSSLFSKYDSKNKKDFINKNDGNKTGKSNQDENHKNEGNNGVRYENQKNDDYE